MCHPVTGSISYNFRYFYLRLEDGTIYYGDRTGNNYYDLATKTFHWTIDTDKVFIDSFE